MSYSGKFKDKNNNLHPVTSVLYGTCDTAAATAAKVVTCTDFDALMTGVTIRVKFANANTAASPTVNINSTGAKSVYRFGSTAPVDGNSWNAGEVVELVYDGTSFFMTGADDLSVKQNVTDNSLQTTDKTVVGAINEHEGDISSLKSGLTNVDVALNVPNGTGKNLVDATTFDSYTSDKGITVTPNGTGGIAFSGTNSGTGATGVLLLKSGYGIQLKAGKTYRFSGNWSGVTHGSTSIRLDLRPYNTLDVLASESNDGIGTFTPSEDMTVRMYARVAGSYAIPNDVIAYPMLTELTDTTYTPYIPSVESRVEAVESGLVKITKESFEQITVNAGSKKFVTNVGLLTDNVMVTAYSDNSDVIAYVATGTTTYQVYLYNPTNAAVTSNITVMVAKV